MNDSAHAYRILCALPGVGPVTLNRLLQFFGGDPWAVLKATPRDWANVKGVGDSLCETLSHWKDFLDPEKEDRALAAIGARWVGRDHADFPQLLRELPDTPMGLYAQGAGAVSRKAVAIVGTRRPTLYGRETAHRLAGELARLGFWIVSGGARGIDTAAHKGALEAGGQTAVVFGCGLDITYPPENLDLFREAAKTGVVYSEFPLGRRADKQTFPQRNRLISGMSLATIIVESDERGGSILTANFAADQGRQVFAVPGRIDQPSSRGCHALIRDGATLLTSADDIIEALRFDSALELDFSEKPSAQSTPAPALSALTPAEATVLAQLEAGAIRSADDISSACALPISACGAALMMLELKKRVVKHADGRYEMR